MKHCPVMFYSYAVKMIIQSASLSSEKACEHLICNTFLASANILNWFPLRDGINLMYREFNAALFKLWK